ncbi:hypothetical protein DM01DRAFT_299585 [Hesseltinella vesiculosa]|uniref:Xylanolytic transcriptional activator regulatory domain-containing protein n=1 Tax=Hesseltinella vesiculosa TaxID=101127 RepID=A0A1X2GKS3_9FUNG|nr:hypothetical protein DM01DRAFT_299585 [Hesseltinella vesiculosa]
MELLLTHLTNTSIQDLELNDFKPDFRPTHRRNVSEPTSVITESSTETEDDDDYDSYKPDNVDTLSTDEAMPSSLSNDSPMNYAKEHLHDKERDDLVQAYERLNLKEYDTLRYSGMSAGIRDLHEDLFKKNSCISWPGRNDTMIQLMPNQQLMVVRTEKSSTGKLDTFLGVGLSISSGVMSSSSNQRSSVSYPLSPDNGKPSKAVLDKTIEMYFTLIHPTLPIINKVQFLQYYHASPHVLPKILYEAIIAVALRHSSQERAEYNTWATHYFRKVMKRLRDSVKSKLCQVQAALLMTLYLEMDGDDVESVQWYTLGKAIRMAQDLGLHRSCEYWHLPRSETETRHRVFYACYILDRWIGARAGKPLTILDRDFDTKMPSVYEVYDDDAQKPKGKQPPIYRAFVQWIKLSEILGRILKSLYAPSAKMANSNANLDDPTILMVFDRRLALWKASLKEPMDETLLPPPEKDMLLFYYYTLILLLRRPFKQLPVQQFPQLQSLILESRQVCMETAQNISLLVKQRQSLPHDKMPLLLHTCYIYGMFLSSLAWLSSVVRDRTCDKKLQGLRESMTLIRTHPQLATSQRALDILNMMVTLYGVGQPPSISPMSHAADSPTPSVPATPVITRPSTTDPVDNNRAPVKSEIAFTSFGPHSSNNVYDYPLVEAPPPTSLATDTHLATPPLSQQTPNVSAIIDPYALENEAPKSHWYQRMVNSSVLGGGITMSSPVSSFHQPHHTQLASTSSIPDFLHHGFVPSNFIPTMPHCDPSPPQLLPPPPLPAKMVPSMTSLDPSSVHPTPSSSSPVTTIDPYSMLAPTNDSSPANLNWQDWQYYMNQHHHDKV